MTRSTELAQAPKPLPEPRSKRSGLSAPEREMLELIGSGDEEAFMVLVERHNAEMTSVASLFAPAGDSAEAIVEEAWGLVLTELASAEHAGSLTTWILDVVRRVAEAWDTSSGKGTPQMVSAEMSRDPAFPLERFHRAGASAGHWRRPPRTWDGGSASAWKIDGEAVAVASRAIESLPGAQRTVVQLRDVEGWSSVDVCACLEMDEATQRALLHRGRSRIRDALERHLETDPRPRVDTRESRG